MKINLPLNISTCSGTNNTRNPINSINLTLITWMNTQITALGIACQNYLRKEASIMLLKIKNCILSMKILSKDKKIPSSLLSSKLEPTLSLANLSWMSPFQSIFSKPDLYWKEQPHHTGVLHLTFDLLAILTLWLKWKMCFLLLLRFPLFNWLCKSLSTQFLGKLSKGIFKEFPYITNK